MLSNKYNSIFDLDGLEFFSEYYNLYILPFQYLYQSKPKWRDVQYTTINGVKSRTLSLLNTLPLVSREINRIVLSENITSNNQYLNSLIFTPQFNTNLRKLLEQVFALGYGVIKTYIDGGKDDNGNVVSNFSLKYQFYPATRFIPISWDNEHITEAVFIDKFTKQNTFYTKLEYHINTGKDYLVRQELYKSNSVSILGYLTPLEEVFGNTLSPHIYIKDYNSQLPLFSVINNPISNNINSDLPISPSLFIDSLDTLKALDITYDSLSREFILGKKRIIVPSTAVRKVVDPVSNRMIQYFDPNDEVYQAMSFENTDSLKIQDNTLTLRVDDHIKALNFYLNSLAMQLGLSCGSLTFDEARGIRTATEVIANNFKTARFTKFLHEQLKTALLSLVESSVHLAYSYDLISTDTIDNSLDIIIPDSVIELDTNPILEKREEETN